MTAHLRGHIEPAKENAIRVADLGIKNTSILPILAKVTISSSWPTLPQVIFYESTTANAQVAVRVGMVCDGQRNFTFRYPRSWGFIDPTETKQTLLKIMNLCLNNGQTAPDGFIYYHIVFVHELTAPNQNLPCLLYDLPSVLSPPPVPPTDMAVINKSAQPRDEAPSPEGLSGTSSSLSVIPSAEEDLVERVILKLVQLGIIKN